MKHTEYYMHTTYIHTHTHGAFYCVDGVSGFLAPNARPPAKLSLQRKPMAGLRVHMQARIAPLVRGLLGGLVTHSCSGTSTDGGYVLYVG